MHFCSEVEEAEEADAVVVDAVVGRAMRRVAVDITVVDRLIFNRKIVLKI